MWMVTLVSTPCSECGSARRIECSSALFHGAQLNPLGTVVHNHQEFHAVNMLLPPSLRFKLFPRAGPSAKVRTASVLKSLRPIHPCAFPEDHPLLFIYGATGAAVQTSNALMVLVCSSPFPSEEGIEILLSLFLLLQKASELITERRGFSSSVVLPRVLSD